MLKKEWRFLAGDNAQVAGGGDCRRGEEASGKENGPVCAILY
jgi:hypothetical protein